MKGCRVTVNFHIADLCELIEEVREELIRLGTVKPFTDPEVIRISQRLDLLLNEYEYLSQSSKFVIETKGA